LKLRLPQALMPSLREKSLSLKRTTHAKWVLLTLRAATMPASGLAHRLSQRTLQPNVG
jgi:hypothetical protein